MKFLEYVFSSFAYVRHLKIARIVTLSFYPQKYSLYPATLQSEHQFQAQSYSNRTTVISSYSCSNCAENSPEPFVWQLVQFFLLCIFLFYLWRTCVIPSNAFETGSSWGAVQKFLNNAERYQFFHINFEPYLRIAWYMKHVQRILLKEALKGIKNITVPFL